MIDIAEVYHYDEWCEYDGSDPETGLFTKYINALLKIKQEASGWPDWVIVPDDDAATEANKDKYIIDYVERTRIGRAMRAVGEDREIAALMGVDVDRTIVFTFGIGGALAGAAGILYVFLFNQVIFTMGFFPGLKAFTAAVLGGIGSITGAALGGLILGILETVGPNLFLDGAGVPSPNQLIPIVAFGILVLVLIFLPGGFLGAPDDKSRA